MGWDATIEKVLSFAYLELLSGNNSRSFRDGLNDQIWLVFGTFYCCNWKFLTLIEFGTFLPFHLVLETLGF